MKNIHMTAMLPASHMYVISPALACLLCCGRNMHLYMFTRKKAAWLMSLLQKIHMDVPHKPNVSQCGLQEDPPLQGFA